MSHENRTPELTETRQDPSAREIWWLAHVHCHIETLKSLGRHQSNAAHELLSDDLHAFARDLTGCWERWLDCAHPDGFETESQRHLFELPERIVFDEANGAIRLDWPSSLEQPIAGVPHALLQAHAAAMVSSPFMGSELEAFPDGTLFLPIHAPLHTATVICERILQTYLEDVGRIVAADDHHVMDRLRQYLAVQRRAATMQLQSLRDDDFRSWRREQQTPDRAVRIPQAVCDSSATIRGQCFIAFDLLTELIENTCKNPVNNEGAADIPRTSIDMSPLHSVLKHFQGMAHGFTLARVHSEGLIPNPDLLETIPFPVPEGLPVIAIYPD